LDKVDLVLPVSEQIGQSLVAGGVHSERVRVLYSGLNLDAVPTQVDPQGMRHQLGIPAEAQVLGTVANLFARKGYDVMLEAMAMRKPVVATTTGGLPEIVQDGQTGLLVPPGEPNALAQAIVNLLQDSTRRVAMGRSGRSRVETIFTVEAMMDRLIAAYGLLLVKEASLSSSVSV